MGLGLLQIPFLTRDGKEDFLTYELLDHSLAKKWKALYHKCELLKGKYLPDYVLYGGNILTHEELYAKIFSSLSFLGNKDLLNVSSDQEYLNRAHVFFEKAYAAAGPLENQTQEMRDALRMLNQSIHQIESFRTGKDFLLNSRFSLAELKVGIDQNENRFFTPERKWGMLYLNYCHIGESYLDVFLNHYPVEPVPQTQLSCDFFLSFMNQSLLPDEGPFLKWLSEKYGREVTLEEFPIGYAPIAFLKNDLNHIEALEFFRTHPLMGPRLLC